MTTNELSRLMRELSARRKTKLGGKPKPTNCRWCGAAYPTRSAARQHQAVCANAVGYGAGRRRVDEQKKGKR